MSEAVENTEIFPQIKDVVHPRYIVPGLEFTYVRAENLKSFHDEGWVQIASSEPFERAGHTYVVMRRGTPIGRGASVIPKVMVNEPMPEKPMDAA
jgi:hypothetical protein